MKSLHEYCSNEKNAISKRVFSYATLPTGTDCVKFSAGDWLIKLIVTQSCFFRGVMCSLLRRLRAVNMINLDLDHLCTRTRAGHGLRETLFYRLFGELQVYETREYMRRAQPCIEQGAVSLDGAIMRGHGAVSLGCWEPEILFPIAPTESQAHPSPDTLELLEKIEAKKSGPDRYNY